ncbi:MAG TPA: beta-hydroxyacyl-ACP dehydratase [Bacteroidaceae bacterium]|nr:beta-hydroxyacyl-ACP dehydratase [Bacteroidaceae bacterium]
MLLENKYYQIEEATVSGMKGTFRIHLLPDYNIYRGHFPSHPVCPGVCHIETIKECTMRLIGKKMTILTIRQCRFLAVATPSTCPEVNVTIDICPVEEGFKVTARIADGTKIYADFKGIMTV